MDRLRNVLPYFAGVPVAAAYALLIRAILGSENLRQTFGTMTVGFVFVAPLAIGVLAVSLAPRDKRTSFEYGAIVGLAAGLSGLVMLVLFQFEILICVVMLAPAALAMSTMGALFATWIARRIHRPERQSHLALAFAVLPLLVTPLESALPLDDSVRAVTVRQPIRADAATVWHHITNFEQIGAREHRPSAFHLLGLPKPVAATLMGSGPGVVRQGVYDNGLLFREVVTDWQPERRFAFTIAIDPSAPIPAPYDAIGGRYFELLSAEYAIETMPDGTTVLVLESTHRVSTHFNAYGGAWTEFILANLQGYLLRIVKDRAERSA